ncbi:MAG: hypothetical protein QOI91_518 [Solirubrobacteraceae bacterium]|jgi:hypothetical protein|nr:hypothetical protein [Solirubrobacteraceae bacterium]
MSRRVPRGRRSGRACQAPSRRNRNGRRYTRLVTKGTFVHAGLAGLNRFKFSGRLRGRKLPVGSYRLTARAKDAARNNALRTLSVSFRIVR